MSEILLTKLYIRFFSNFIREIENILEFTPHILTSHTRLSGDFKNPMKARQFSKPQVRNI